MPRTQHQGRHSLDVSCGIYREALSAAWDNEVGPVEAEQLQAHLATCAPCALWQSAAPDALRPLRVRAAAAPPDLTERILTAVLQATARPRLVVTLARAALLAVAIMHGTMAFLTLVSGDGVAHAFTHLAHESGAWNIAFAIALGTAAIRPRSATALLPMVVTLVGLLAVVSAADLATGDVGIERVLTHLLMLVGLVLLSVMAWHDRKRAPRRPGGTSFVGRRLLQQ